MTLEKKYEVNQSNRKDEFVKALDRIKQDFIPQECYSTSPLFIIAGGQPGSGKTSMIETIKNQYSKRNFLVIDLDSYRSYHPDFKEIKEKHKKEGVILTNNFAFAIEDEMIDFAQKNSLNTINVSTLRNTDLEMNLVKQVNSLGFKCKAYVLAVCPEESYFSALIRYQEQQEDKDCVTRFTSKGFHDEAYKSLNRTVMNFIKLGVPIAICKRGKNKAELPQVVYDEEANIYIVNDNNPIAVLDTVRRTTKCSAVSRIKENVLNLGEEDEEIQQEYKEFCKEIEQRDSERER